MKMFRYSWLVLVFILMLFVIGCQKSNQGAKNKANVSWYSEDGTEFTITSKEQMMDLMALSEFYDFQGQTFKLQKDIVFNEGDSSTWSANNVPTNRWYPIRGFAGTFDGQGHTISGVYGYGVDVTMGLFAGTKSQCVIKDFRLLNSYFEVDGACPVGSVIADGSGTLEKIYSDAILVTNSDKCGGMIGEANPEGTDDTPEVAMTKIKNCWFAGQIKLQMQTGRMGGGIIGYIHGSGVEIKHTMNSGSIVSSYQDSDEDFIGGLLGVLHYGNGNAMLTIEDCLNIGTIDLKEGSYVGSLVGCAYERTELQLLNVVTATESYGLTIGKMAGTMDGEITKLSKSNLNEDSPLDFDNFWTLGTDGTVILKSFSNMK